MLLAAVDTVVFGVTLGSASLVVSVQTSFGGNYGLVVSTDPQAGVQVRRGSTVTLYVI